MFIYSYISSKQYNYYPQTNAEKERKVMLRKNKQYFASITNSLMTLNYEYNITAVQCGSERAWIYSHKFL